MNLGEKMNARFCSLKRMVQPACRNAALALLFSVGAAQGASSSADQNWPQWRGPLATGTAPSGNPPSTWSETSNVKWKVRIPGNGAATPIIWGDQVFIQTAIATGKKVEVATEQKPAPAPEAAPVPAAANAPATNQPAGDQAGRRRRPGGGGPGGMGGMRGEKPDEAYQFVLLCLDRQTGKTLWQKVAREEVPHEGYRQNDGSFAS